MERHKTIDTLLNEVRAAYERERNAKNKMYLFVEHLGLYDELFAWESSFNRGTNFTEELEKEFSRKDKLRRAHRLKQ